MSQPVSLSVVKGTPSEAVNPRELKQAQNKPSGAAGKVGPPSRDMKIPVPPAGPPPASAIVVDQKLEVKKQDPSIPQFSPSLEAALSEVLPSDDPLDGADFDPIDYINKTFPDERSLSGDNLPGFLKKIQGRMVVLSEGITKDVRDHSVQAGKTKNAIKSATAAIDELFQKINAIKEKAAHSETLVEDICKDVKELDYAKKHLTNSISALRNLHMLVSAVDQLTLMRNRKQYKEAANLFKAITDLFTLFKDYKEVPRIKALAIKIEENKHKIQMHIVEEFHRELERPINPEDDNSERYQQLNSACAIIDVLEPQVKKELVKWFCDQQLHSYVYLFDVGKEGGNLEQTERRYHWLTEKIKEYENAYIKVFPENWNMLFILCQQFCIITKDQLSRILESLHGKIDTNHLIRALQKTIAMERELNGKFRNVTENYYTTLFAQEAKTSAEIKAKYATLSRRESKRDAPSSPTPRGSEARISPPASPTTPPPSSDDTKFDGLISDLFTPYMSGFVDLERANLRELIAKIEREEKWLVSTEAVKHKQRLGGSDDLFLYMKKSIKRCSQLATNQTFFNVFKEYKSVLNQYCVILDSHIAVGPKLPEERIFNIEQIVSVLLIVNTSEYVQETITPLEESIKQIIDFAYQEHVKLGDTAEEFGKLITKGVQSIAASINNRLSRGLATMIKINWGVWEGVGDQSDYVNQINAILMEDVPYVAKMLSSTYHNFFCTQLVSAFIPKYVQSIFKCKRINELGGQQLALDAHSLKSILLNIPNLGKAEESSEETKSAPNRAFSRYVNREMGRAEALLKTLVSPPDRMIGAFVSLLSTPKERPNTEDLVKVMNLRGIKKSEQQALFESYNSNVSAEERVAPPVDSAGGLSNLFRKLENIQIK